MNIIRKTGWQSPIVRALAAQTFASMCNAFPGLLAANARRTKCGVARGQRIAAAKWFRELLSSGEER